MDKTTGHKKRPWEVFSYHGNMYAPYSEDSKLKIKKVYGPQYCAITKIRMKDRD